jgi:uncharacterized membrane protein HdeD (DUF308 family)
MPGAIADLYKQAWWMLLIRGIVAVLFGILAITWPGLTLATLIIFFGAFALVHGVFAVIGSIAGRKEADDWWLVLLEGILGIIIGIMTFAWPALTGLVLAYFIAAWALINGILRIYGAIKLRRVIEGEWLLIISGIIGVLFAIFVFARPLAGALAIILFIGIYAIVLGLLGIILSFRIKGWQEKAEGAGV